MKPQPEFATFAPATPDTPVPISYEDILHSLVVNDERFVVMTAENRVAIRNLPQKIGNRFIDVGICEQTMIGAAAGLALRGRIPVVHALATFLTMRAFEFIRTDVGIPGLPVKIVGTFAGFISEANGPTHQSLEDIALMRGIPHVNVWCPADLQDMLIGMEQVMRDPNPCYIRYNGYPATVKHQTEFTIGRAEVWSRGRDVTLLTYGMLFSECLRAADILAAAGLSVGLVNMRMLKPVDTQAILDAADDGGLLVVVEDHFKTGGLYSIIAETLLDHGVSAPALSLAFDSKWFKPAMLKDVLEYEGFTGEDIARRVQDRLSHAAKTSSHHAE
jgi:transketolase